MNPKRAVFLGKEQREQTLFSIVRACQCHVRLGEEDRGVFLSCFVVRMLTSAVLKFLPASLVFFPCFASSCDLVGLN